MNRLVRFHFTVVTPIYWMPSDSPFVAASVAFIVRVGNPWSKTELENEAEYRCCSVEESPSISNLVLLSMAAYNSE
jgi:hypothetical protein